MKRIASEGLIHENVRMENVALGDYVEIGRDSYLSNTSLGDFSYCGERCVFQNTIILKFSNIAQGVRIGATDHPMKRATLHHFTYRSALYGMGDDDAAFFEERASRITTIGHDTWLGHNCIIKPDIRIGHGAIVGSGAVVTKDVPDYAIVVGNPARLLRYRFDAVIREKLLKLSWWDWPYEVLKERLNDFRENMEDFLEKYGGHYA